MEIIIAYYQFLLKLFLRASFAISRLQSVLKKEKIDLATVLSFGHYIVKSEINLNFKFTDELIGNSLDIGDESEFVCDALSNKENSRIEEWWNGVSDFKKKLYSPIIEVALIYNRLREMSRWLVAKHIDHLRKLLPDKKNIYFATLEETKNNVVDEKLCAERKAQYESFSRFHLPAILTHVPFKKETNYQGISPGIGEGFIVTEKEIDGVKDKKILYTKILSPDLVKYFDQIEGIISEEGGMLSHLAIIARERAMPVVIVGNNNFQIGSKIKIDGGSGEIEKL